MFFIHPPERKKHQKKGIFFFSKDLLLIFSETIFFRAQRGRRPNTGGRRRVPLEALGYQDDKSEQKSLATTTTTRPDKKWHGENLSLSKKTSGTYRNLQNNSPPFSPIKKHRFSRGEDNFLEFFQSLLTAPFSSFFIFSPKQFFVITRGWRQLFYRFGKSFCFVYQILVLEIL